MVFVASFALIVFLMQKVDFKNCKLVPHGEHED